MLFRSKTGPRRSGRLQPKPPKSSTSTHPIRRKLRYAPSWPALAKLGARLWPIQSNPRSLLTAGAGHQHTANIRSRARLPSPTCGRTQPREAGSDEGSGEGGGRLRITALNPYRSRVGPVQAAKSGTGSSPDFRTENSTIFQRLDFGPKFSSLARLPARPSDSD